MSPFPYEIPDSPICGKSVVVTGPLAHFPDPEAFCTLVEHYGGRITVSPDADTACTVGNTPPAPQSRIPHLSEADFLTLLARGCHREPAEADFLTEGGVLVKYTGHAPDAVIPPGIHTVGPHAFKGCKHLRSVYMGEGIRSIGEAAFAQCPNLQGILLPATLRSIGSQAFIHCSKLRYLGLPEGLETIEKEAFYWAGNLQALVIPSTVSAIGQEAFFACSQLKVLTFRPGIRTIGCSAFSFCSRLTELTLPQGTVPDAGAFSNCRDLQSLSLPPDLTEIAHSLFSGCSSLRALTVPEGVKSIGVCAFENCQCLCRVSLPQSLSVIDNSAFSNCGFQSLTIPSGVETVGINAFRSSLLRSISIPEGVTTVGDMAFFNCFWLETVTLPHSLRDLGPKAFHHCRHLRTVTLPETLGQIPGDLFYGCRDMADAQGFLINGSTLISAFLEERTQLVIPPGITAIRDYALFDAEALETVVVPPGVTDLGDHFLQRLTELKSVLLPPSVTTLKHYSISGCNALKRLQAPGLSVPLLSGRRLFLPATVGYLCCPEAYTDSGNIPCYHQWAAMHREEILAMVLEEDWVSALETYGAIGQITAQNFDQEFLQPALDAQATQCVFFLLNWKNTHLRSDSGHELFSQPDWDPFSDADLQHQWKVAECDGGCMILCYRGQQTQVQVPPRIGSQPVCRIASCAFSPKNSMATDAQRHVLAGLQEVHLMPGITRIGAGAFDGCAQLRQVTLPATVAAIASRAFDGCPRLTIRAPAGSFAEAYAKQKKIPFLPQQKRIIPT